jgi:hypothetical protein
VSDDDVAVSDGAGDDDAVSDETTAVGSEEGDADEPPRPIWPQTAPAMRPITAVRASATRTIAPAGIEPREPRRRVIIPPA